MTLIFDHLGAITLKQLVDEQKTRQSGVVQMLDMRKAMPERERKMQERERSAATSFDAGNSLPSCLLMGVMLQDE